MNISKTLKSYFKLSYTKFGLLFAFALPLLFSILWLTGYNGATTRIDQLKIGLVNEDTTLTESVFNALDTTLPFQLHKFTSIEQARDEMDNGMVDMVMFIPGHFKESIGTGHSEISYYVNQANANVAISVLESSAEKITTMISRKVLHISHQDDVQSNIIKDNEVSNFSFTMIPMILGFISYIAVMTMTIQLNVSTLMLKAKHGMWALFWARQIILVAVSILAPLVITGFTMFFVETVASFWIMWGFQILVYLACICLTQMTFVLMNHWAAFINTALVPLQLMTAGYIVPSSFLSPFYKNIGDFLPASNAIQGYLRLTYSGASISNYVIYLILIAAVTWGITFTKVILLEKKEENQNLLVHAN
ncbi:YhgE/Pip domain-containing protein [Bacillus sp. NPDC060175]|uniref:YhgE/Pip domain-containing protein n=1 Tax=Bacillus sp. NPDC060175 TaxID=3347061 RepID=UPI0036628603